MSLSKVYDARLSYPYYLFDGLNYDLDKPLFIDAHQPNRNLSARKMKTLISKFVGGLKRAGLKRNDSVLVMAFNDIYYTPLYLGIIAAGGIFTGTNPGYTAFEVEHQLRTCKTEYIIASMTCMDVAVKAARAVGIPRENIWVFNPLMESIPFDCKSFWNLIQHGEGEWVTVEDPAKEACSFINSSGTSGPPKAVVISHKYLENQVAGLVKRKLPYEVSRLICIPPFSGYNVPSQHGAPIKAGEPAYIMPRYEPNMFVRAIERYKITETLLIPPILLSLPQSSACNKEALSSLRQIFCGGAAVGKGVQQMFYDLLHPDARIAQIYGMTELGWVCGSLYPEKDQTGSVGVPLESYTLKIVNKTEDMISEPCVDGEIWVKALYPMLGYFENDAATEAAFALGGWIRTGDVGHFTREGLYYITDRLKDMIKVRGWQVSPAELEDVLMMHPDIIDAAVIGAALPEPSTEEEIHAFIVARPDSGLDEAAVKQFMRERLARFKIASDVFFMKELPRNPTGKIVRRNLKTVYAAFVVEEEKRKYFEQRRIPDFAPPIVHEVIGNEHGTDCTCIKCENGDKENRAEEAV